jgi:hypothetical protein
MKISKIHRRFSKDQNEPKTLTNPEDFLGPNWENVINFWLYLDTLNEDEKRKMNDSYWALEWDVRVSAWSAAWVAAKEVVGGKVTINSGYAAYYVNNRRCVFANATNELIAQHKILEQDKTLVALPLCLNP